MGVPQTSPMKTIHQKNTIKIPDDVELTVKSRVVSVKGARGELSKSFHHMDVDLKHSKDANTITVVKWFGKKKELSAIKTVCSHITNLFLGVTVGFKYKMRLVYAHFPVNVGIADNGEHITVMNFIGQKVRFEVDALEGVKMQRDPKEQSIFSVEGNDVENVSRTCALISQSCKVRNKDIRKFLDGIYVFSKGPIKAFVKVKVPRHAARHKWRLHFTLTLHASS